MGIPLSIFLIIYLILAGIALLLTMVNLYHVLRFGHYDAQSYFMTGVFTAGLILIGFVSLIFISEIDWTQEITLFSSSNTTVNPTSTPGTQF